MADDGEGIVVSMSDDGSLYDELTHCTRSPTTKDKFVMEPTYVEYVIPEWWYQPAKPPILVNLCSGENCDIDINDNENVSRLSYWSLPFPKKAFREHKGFNLRRMLWKYKNYILNDPERLKYLPGLSGLRLGYQSVRTTHGHILVQLFEQRKITRGDVYMCQHYCGAMPKTLRSEEMETVRRYNDRHRHWTEDTVLKKKHRRHYHSGRTYETLHVPDRRRQGRRNYRASRTPYAYIPKGMENMTYKEYVDSYMCSTYK